MRPSGVGGTIAVRRFRDTLSFALWGLVVGARALGAVLRALVVVTTRAITDALLAARSWAGAAQVALAAVTVVVVAEPALHLASHPVARTLASRGLPPLEQRSTVLAADGAGLAVLHDGVNRRAVPLDRVPQVLRDAVVAAEDRRFWRHGGFDTEAVARAALANLSAGQVTQGASTVSQQLAKVNFVGSEPTVARKAKELLYAVALEDRFSKPQLLERYLNQVYFGSGAYGVAAAAEEYFGVQVDELTREQAALLAGLIRAPVAADPRYDPEAARLRRNQVLAAMGAPSGSLDAPLGVVAPRSREPAERFAVEAVKREFLANPAFGPDEPARRRLLLTGGLEIRSTLEPRIQDAARRAADLAPDGLGTAIVAVDPRTGAIRALHDGGTAGSGHFDVATQGRRQPGSTFKPVAALAALEAGIPLWQSLVGDGPVELDYRRGMAPWRVGNYKGADYGYVGLREAVVYSVNTAFAQLGVALGPERLAETAGRLGVDVPSALGPPTQWGPSLAIGGLAHGVSPLELAGAYATFAAGGTRAAPYLIDRVLGPDGRELWRAEPRREVVVDRAVNAELVGMLQDVLTEGTGTAAALRGWRPLGKTGTSEGSADAWFAGAVPVLSAAVWVGDPAAARPVPGLTGGTAAAPVWRAFMAGALDGVVPVGFPGEGEARGRAGLRVLDLPVARLCGPGCTTSA